VNQPKPSENTLGNTALFILSFLIVAGAFFAIASRSSSNLLNFARSSPIILGSIGAVIAATRRFLSRKRRGDRSLFYIIVSDFTFDNYATLSILSFVYALVQGSCFGLATGFTLTAVVFQMNGITSAENPAPIIGILISLLTIFVIRLAIEGYTVVYRTAQDAGAFFRGRGRDVDP
jgi:hypothetical protein